MYLYCKFNRLFVVAWNLRPATWFFLGIRLQPQQMLILCFWFVNPSNLKVQYIPFDIIP